MASISGSVLNPPAAPSSAWLAIAWDAFTHAYAGSAVVSEGGYTISGLTAGQAYVVTIRPKMERLWPAAASLNEGALCVPTDPLTTPFVFEATTVDIQDGDTEFDHVALLLAMDGGNGSGSFTDSSSHHWTVTPSGSVTQSNTQVKFGDSSMGQLNGGKYLTIASNAAFSFSGPFTVEFWVYPVSFVAPSLCGIFNVGAYSNLMVRIRSDRCEVFCSNDNSGRTFYMVSPTAMPTNAWSHIAVTRDASNDIRFFFNGAQQGASQLRSGAVSAGDIVVGKSQHTTAEYLNGYIDDVRFTPGVCRHASNFSVPTEAYPASGYLVIPTGSSEPSWPETPGDTVADGGVIWTNRGRLVQPITQGPLIAA